MDTHITIPMARLVMLRKCAHRLGCNGHEDLSADVVGLLRRYGLLGSPLRGTEPEHG